MDNFYSMLTKSQIQTIRKKIVQEDNTLTAVFNALSDIGRFRIFKLLSEHEELCVTDIANILDITVSAASQQLKILELNGLVDKHRMGQMVCYRLRKSNPLLKTIMRFLGI